MSDTMLSLDSVSSGYKSSMVLRDLSLTIRRGEAVALLGKNGMGKSTLLKTITGFLPKKTGRVQLQGEDITRMPPHRIAGKGVAYAAQEHALFADLPIHDNLRLGLANEALFEERFPEIERLFPVFTSRLKQLAGTLSGGEQKMLLLARSLMMRPAIIVLDEITEGLQPSVIDRLANALSYEREKHGTSMLIVEQNVPFALQVADRFAILKQGEIVDEGNTKSSDAMDAVFDHLRV
ncbi:ABC transporter ATP-binding protein [Comamonas sp. GB3 AK4-5]|uniref:ABC transporter ATP-binding protein n=1 Tax=Comamonas sp. GB3 AK4-5 TaxID=3231487 RepID=UPI00351ED6F2